MNKSLETDTLRFICPMCQSTVEVTVYHGERKGANYTLENAPISVIAEVSTESQKGQIHCFSCTCDLALPVQRLVSVLPLSDQEHADPNWRINEG